MQSQFTDIAVEIKLPDSDNNLQLAGNIEQELTNLLNKSIRVPIDLTKNIDNFFNIILGEHHNDFFDYLEQNPLFSDIKDRFKIIAKKRLDTEKNIEKEKEVVKDFFEIILNDTDSIIEDLLFFFSEKGKSENNKIKYYKTKHKKYIEIAYIEMLEEIGVKDNVFQKLVDVEELGELVQTLLKNTDNKYFIYDIVFLLIFIRFISTVYAYIIGEFHDLLKNNTRLYNLLENSEQLNNIEIYTAVNDILQETQHLGVGMFEYLDMLEVFNKVLLNVLNYKKNTEFINTVLQPNTEEQNNDIYLTLSRDVKLYGKITNLHNLQLMSKWQEFMEKGLKLKEYLDFVDIHLFKEYPGIINFIDLDKIEKYINFIKRSGLSNKEKALAIELGFIEKENDIIKKLLFIYENTELEISQIQKLTDEQIINIAENHNLALEYLNQIIEGENINDVKKRAEIEVFKEDILNKLSFIPETTGFKQIIEQINQNIEEISFENYDKKKKEISKLFDNNLKKIYDSIKKLLEKNVLSLDEIKNLFILLNNKKTKKNKLKNSNILNLLDYLLENFDKEEIDFIKNLLENKQITSYFVENYQTMISFFVKNQNIIESIDDNGTILKQLYENLQNKITEANVKNVIKTYFPESLEDEIYEYYQQNPENFDKLVTIAKKLENKKDDKFYLELILLENDEFKRFYFLVKNLSILGIDLKYKYEKLLNLIKENQFTEEKLRKLKEVLKGDILDYIDKDFFYTLFLDYIYGEENIDVFKVLMRPKEEEIVDKKFEKNKGLEGLADINGSQALKKFERLGYEVQRTNGSHYFMRHKKTNQPLLFPFHNPIKASTLFGILNRAGIKKEEFLEK